MTKPKYYTSKDGGFFIPWPGYRITQAQLDHKRKGMAFGQRHIWIEGTPVHALIWADGSAWDVINGWRPTKASMDWEDDPACIHCGRRTSPKDPQCWACGKPWNA